MKKTAIIVLSLLLILSLFAGCAASSADSAATESSYAEDSNMDYGGGETGMPTADTSEEALFAEYGRKIIFEASMDIETLEFDESYNAILDAVNSFGGYVSSQSTNGGYRYSSDRYSSRYAEMTLRIPSERYAEFLKQGSSFGNVTHLSNSEQDVTAQYIDTEARLESLRAQEERLLAMLDRANTLDELLLLEDHLADIRYEIESYTSMLKSYDNLTTYSTVTIYLNEVSTITQPDETFGAQLKTALSGSLHAAVAFFQGLILFLIYAMPYLILIVAILLLVRFVAKRRKAKRLEKFNQAMQQNQQNAPPSDKP